MSRADLMLWLPGVFQALFVFALGASIGSLINVLVYRIPRGLSVVRPPSRCPACDTRLTWRENVPILGWLLLRGRCRFCGERISPEYPIVESFVACLFTLVFVLFYLVPPHAEFLGIAWGSISPEWARNGLVATWPMLAVVLFLFGSLVAMTIIDARTYTIPLVLAWAPTVFAFVVLPAHAGWFGLAHGGLTEARPGFWLAPDGSRWYSAEGWLWSLATPGPGGWVWIFAGLGGVAGIPVSLLLQRLGLIGHSFADYEAWEQQAIADEEARRAATDEHEAAQSEPDGSVHLWIQYPHARREMFTEAAFVSPVVLLAIGGAWLGGAVPLPAEAPLWLTVLGGVCLGYLIGGGIVWAVRIFGSLLFGKEAMGIGDVHLMAAVGACLGWPDAVLGFFGAAFVGLAYAVAGVFLGGRLKRAMPFGPFLAVSTVLVVLAKPAVEAALGNVFVSAGGVDLP